MKKSSYSLSLCLISCIVVVLLVSCNQPKNQHKSTLSETEELDLNLPAMYSGTLPCADCPGIDYQLILEENRFTEISHYQDRSAGNFEEKGTWKVNGDTLTLIGLEDLILKRFLVDESSLTLLDMNSQRVTGDLADMYVLERAGNQQSIREHHQKLAEQGFTFFAAGNEPFWSLKIDSLNRAMFETPDSSINFGEVNRSTLKNVIFLEASTDSTQHSIQIQVQEEYCQDSMSGYLFPQTVTATLHPSEVDTLRGCGIYLDR